MKNILVLDTSTERAATRVCCQPGREKVFTSTSESRRRRHGRDLIPCVSAILR